jgi:arylsulfatase
VLDCKASDKDDPTEDPRFGQVGKQVCKNTGPLNTKRMETLEDDLLAHSLDFIDRSVKAGKPFFLWHASSRMHVWTHLSPKWKDKTGYGLYADGMAELDNEVGEILKKLDALGIAENTIVVFSSDNGAEIFTWPDGGMNPFKGEKGTTWEGGFRVPTVVRWPGVVKPGTVINDIFSHEDWLPTFLAAAGDPDVKQKLLTGMEVGDKAFKTHLDGYNMMPFLKGDVAASPRHEFFFFDDNANLNALRYEDWKIHFAWIEGHLFSGKRTSANVPLVVNLRQDPFERTPFESDFYRRFQADKLWTLVPAQVVAGQFIQSFKEYPPSQRVGSMNLDQVMEQLQSGASK